MTVEGAVVLLDGAPDTAQVGTAPGQQWLWNSFETAPAARSVPRHLEDNAERLRARYLAFVHDLGEHRVSGRNIREWLTCADGFGYWWTTQVAEKSPLKTL